MQKKTAAVIFGGTSVEHDVSIVTGLQVIENLEKSKYEIIPVYWSQENKFLTCFDFKEPTDILKKIFRDRIEVTWDINARRILFSYKSLLKQKRQPIVDIIIPALHGTCGEDGSFQGLLEILDIPYAGSNPGASYLSMDKDLFKQMMVANNISVLPWQSVLKSDVKNFKIEFEYPVVCKPNALGSSIGVKKCRNDKQLREAFNLIFSLDTKALIEPYISDMIEVNCSVLGDNTSQKTSVCERPISKGAILDFEDKYLSGSKTKLASKVGGMASQDRVIPADISDKLTKSIQETAKKVFTTLNCSGVTRIDFMVKKKSEQIIVNELNSIPGSFAYYLWEASAMSFAELLDNLIGIALRQHEVKKSLSRTFNSPVLTKFLNS